jgi:hypothetical protein
MCVVPRCPFPSPSPNFPSFAMPNKSDKLKTMKKKRNVNRLVALSTICPSTTMQNAEVEASLQPRLLLVDRMASWLNSCLRLPIAAPVGSCVLSRLWSFSRLVRLASLVVLPSAIRSVVKVLAWLFRLASFWLMSEGLGGAVRGVTRSMLFVAVERVAVA